MPTRPNGRKWRSAKTLRRDVTDVTSANSTRDGPRGVEMAEGTGLFFPPGCPPLQLGHERGVLGGCEAPIQNLDHAEKVPLEKGLHLQPQPGEYSTPVNGVGLERH